LETPMAQKQDEIAVDKDALLVAAVSGLNDLTASLKNIAEEIKGYVTKSETDVIGKSGSRVNPDYLKQGTPKRFTIRSTGGFKIEDRFASSGGGIDMEKVQEFCVAEAEAGFVPEIPGLIITDTQPPAKPLRDRKSLTTTAV
jgi:hypothetical protein